MSMPKQKPGRSKQDYGTPPELLRAIKSRLHITDFSIDLAASKENAITQVYLTEADDALRPDMTWNHRDGQWAWLNPPFANLYDWTAKAVSESAIGAHVVMLTPASVGSDWWKECVEPFAYVAFLNGRLTFVGCEDPYPKDCALLFYTPWGFKGNEVWNWRADVPQL